MRRKLLVADDSVTIQRVVALSFAGEDVEVEVAPDGDKALAMVRADHPDVVLADVMMPGLTGYQVCESIKRDPELEKIPVVLLVGTFEPFDQAEATRVQSDGHLTKPFDTDELLRTYRRLVGRAAGRRPIRSAEDKGPWYEPDSEQSARPIVAGEILVSSRTRESFLGETRILDVFPAAKDAQMPAPMSEIGPAARASSPMVRSVIEDIVRRIAPDIVREVAWEVVPEMSEMLIRESLSKGKPPSR